MDQHLLGLETVHQQLLPWQPPLPLQLFASWPWPVLPPAAGAAAAPIHAELAILRDHLGQQLPYFPVQPLRWPRRDQETPHQLASNPLAAGVALAQGEGWYQDQTTPQLQSHLLLLAGKVIRPADQGLALQRDPYHPSRPALRDHPGRSMHHVYPPDPGLVQVHALVAARQQASRLHPSRTGPATAEIVLPQLRGDHPLGPQRHRLRS
mmetsp:Transcript_51238/g.153935  ORF Transcript_51238/g.153935 Transcript_51238/m.153935 type:complete len:208 (-) Transcript_51238:281-904(-)